MDTVIFPKGVRRFEYEKGTVTVHAPRDVRLSDLAPAMTNLAASSRKESAAA